MSDHSSSENEYDSDKELQVAFKKGLLKGLVYESAPEEKEIYNKAGLEDALRRLQNPLSWIERMDVTVDPVPPPKVMLDQIGANPEDLEGEENINNDFKRESKFYRLAQAAVREGIPKLHMLHIDTKRPNDYLAEMAKSDTHMQKIRAKLQSIQTAKERSEKAKKLRELRKFGKKIQQEVLQKKQKEKKETLESIKKYRKGQSSSLDFIENDKKSNDKKSSDKKGKPKPHTSNTKRENTKRELKNKKFGFGGQKKRSKSNTRESVNQVPTPFFKSGKKGNSKGIKQRPGKPGKAKRPGKSKRQNKKH